MREEFFRRGEVPLHRCETRSEYLCSSVMGSFDRGLVRDLGESLRFCLLCYYIVLRPGQRTCTLL